VDEAPYQTRGRSRRAATTGRWTRCPDVDGLTGGLLLSLTATQARDSIAKGGAAGMSTWMTLTPAHVRLR
jgi:hypothetical protein